MMIFRGSSEKPCRFREIDTIATSLYSSGRRACTSCNFATWLAY